MTDFDHRKQETLDWYAQLAAKPAWKGYAWRAVNDLAQLSPVEFGDLPQLLEQRMKEAK